MYMHVINCILKGETKVHKTVLYQKTVHEDTKQVIPGA